MSLCERLELAQQASGTCRPSICTSMLRCKFQPGSLLTPGGPESSLSPDRSPVPWALFSSARRVILLLHASAEQLLAGPLLWAGLFFSSSPLIGFLRANSQCSQG